MLASAINGFKLWNVNKYEEICEVKSNSNICDLSWNSDGKCLASLEESGEISFYAIKSESPIPMGCMNTEISNPSCIQFANTSPKYLGVGNKSGYITLWDVKSHSKKNTYKVHADSIEKITFSVNDSHMVAGTSDGCLSTLSTLNSTVCGPYCIFGTKDRITDIKCSLLSRSLVGCVSSHGSVATFDINTSKILYKSNSVHTGPASSLAFSPVNMLLLISVGYDKKIQCFNTQTKSIVLSYSCPAPLTSVKFIGGGGQFLALGTMTGQIYFYDLKSLKEPVAVKKAHSGSVTLAVVNAKCENGLYLKKKKKFLNNNGLVLKTEALDVSYEDDDSLYNPDQNANSPQILSPIRHTSKQNTPVENSLRSLSLSKNSFDELLSPIRLNSRSLLDNSNVEQSPLSVEPEPVLSNKKNKEESNSLPPKDKEENKEHSISVKHKVTFSDEEEKIKASKNVCDASIANTSKNGHCRKLENSFSLVHNLPVIPEKLNKVQNSENDITSQHYHPIQMDLIHNAVSEVLEDCFDTVKSQLLHYHCSTVKRFLQLQGDIEKLQEVCLINQDLVAEVNRLQEEIKKLKTNF